ncbi:MULTISPECIES: HNH endonuclease [Streptomyces]|uniref:HNH endonuclease n=1 Tax=Streptomyces TaxID=1883 RepID=UPI001D13E84C|nr:MULTISPECIES: HNH endonuclease signature motif containing protein [Streptomyces]MCC3653690.1 HNH endonuclease [Streptomyces sp. S07_1.15]WSQ71791.1 HNH endonuclease [Streptomyces xinghaiensis]
MSGSRRYTKDLLTAAAESCSDIGEVMVFVGAKPYDGLERHLFRRFAHFGIDVSHMRRRPGPAEQAPGKDVLRQAIEKSVSIAGALRLLGIPDHERTRRRLHQWAAEAGISTSHFLGQAHQRGRPGPVPKRKPEEILVKRSGGHRTRTALLRRALLAIGVAERCAECGTGARWQGKPMTLEIDHINGDRTDDRPGNLRLLCPNCHAVTSTWCRGGRAGADVVRL